MESSIINRLHRSWFTAKCQEVAAKEVLDLLGSLRPADSQRSTVTMKVPVDNDYPTC